MFKINLVAVLLFTLSNSLFAQVKNKIANAVKSDMVLVEGGKFGMGCTSEQNSACKFDENPAHDITLKSFSICKFEVTQELWLSVMGWDSSYFQKCPRCPVEQVSWDEAQNFIAKLNKLTGNKYRLPTEAEWEYAARGGNKSKLYKFAGSDSLNEVAWNDNNSKLSTHPVGQKQANELGLYDMCGNVYEWCSDFYGEEYYTNSPYMYPKGPETGDARVIRGGSWARVAVDSHISARARRPASHSDTGVGFRLAMDK